MAKAIDCGMTLTGIRLLEKSGGRSGTGQARAKPATEATGAKASRARGK
jgi:hypothetical protein